VDVGADTAATEGDVMGDGWWKPPALDLLVRRGAGRIEHPGGTLLEHLRRVSSLLEEWGAGDEVQAAGLCHACYGTDGFPVSLLDLDERPLLVSCIGSQAEAWVHLYASCDRAVAYRDFGEPGSLRFRDRFSDMTRELPEHDAAVLVELTAANELDIVMVNPAWGAQVAPELLDLLRSARRRLSEAAWHGCVSTLAGPLGVSDNHLGDVAPPHPQSSAAGDDGIGPAPRDVGSAAF